MQGGTNVEMSLPVGFSSMATMPTPSTPLPFGRVLRSADSQSLVFPRGSLYRILVFPCPSQPQRPGVLDNPTAWLEDQPRKSYPASLVCGLSAAVQRVRREKHGLRRVCMGLERLGGRTSGLTDRTFALAADMSGEQRGRDGCRGWALHTWAPASGPGRVG